jgi:hypothetical protein
MFDCGLRSMVGEEFGNVCESSISILIRTFWCHHAKLKEFHLNISDGFILGSSVQQQFIP